MLWQHLVSPREHSRSVDRNAPIFGQVTAMPLCSDLVEVEGEQFVLPWADAPPAKGIDGKRPTICVRCVDCIAFLRPNHAVAPNDLTSATMLRNPRPSSCFGKPLPGAPLRIKMRKCSRPSNLDAFSMTS